MATKNHSKYLENKHVSTLKESTDLYSNFSLNKSHTCSTAFDQKDSKRVEIGRKSSNYEVTGKTSSQKDIISLKKSHKSNLSKEYFTTNLNDAKEEKGNCSSSNKNSSTLSLHIAAYENFIEIQGADSLVDKKLRKKGTTITASQNVERQLAGLTFNDHFEFPRQQENDPSKPEIQQFAASQKLFAPNQGASSSTRMQPAHLTTSTMENIHLSENFFQEFAEDPTFADSQPTLQILQSRKIEAATICLRLRCSDGVFSFIHCGFDKALAERVDEDFEALDGEQFPVIKVLAYKSLASQDKNTFIITDYELLAKDIPKIGNPTAHNGNADTFKGIASAKRKLEEKTVTTTPKKIAKTDSGAVLPINGISPYISRWRIGGTATGVEPLREINSKKGPMKVFSFVLNDKSGQSIKITSFAETAERFHPQLQENGSYYVSGNQNCIKPANKRFNSTGHDYEITLNHDCVIEMAEEQTFEAPKLVLKKVVLSDLSNHSGQNVDILAVIDNIEDLASVKKKDNTETVRRNIQLIDQSATSVILTLWGDQARGFECQKGSVIAIKNAFVREYMSSYSLAVNSGCRIEIDPDNKDAQQLSDWYVSERQNAEVKSISTQANANSSNFVDELRPFSFFSIPNVFIDPNRGMYFNSVGVITQARSDNALYKSCAEKDCSKKVNEENGAYRCGNNHSSTMFKYRYMANMEISDACGTAWVTFFDKAEAVFGKSAQELGELNEIDPAAYKAVFDSKLFTIHTFRCRGRPETYNDVSRVKFQAYDIRQPNFEQYGDALDAVLTKLEAL